MTTSSVTVPRSFAARCVVRRAWLASTLAFGLVAPIATQAGAPCPMAPSDGVQAGPADSGDKRFASAYGRFVMRADKGDPAAASAALFMLRHGKALFGSDWSATEGQQARWNALAVNAARYRVPVVSNGADD